MVSLITKIARSILVHVLWKNNFGRITYKTNALPIRIFLKFDNVYDSLRLFQPLKMGPEQFL